MYAINAAAIFRYKFLVLALHLEAGSFPKPLSAREEIETFAALRAGDRSAREKIIGTTCGWWPMWQRNTTPSPAIRRT